MSNEALFIRLRLVPVESTHDLAKLILLPILYSVSRVNAYLNSQHPYECPYYKLPMPWSSDKENSGALSSI